MKHFYLYLIGTLLTLSTNVFGFAFDTTQMQELKLELENTDVDSIQYELLIDIITEYEKGERGTAMPFLYKKLAVAERLNDQKKIHATHNKLASHYMLIRNNDSAKYFIDLSLPYYEKIPENPEYASALNNLALIYQRTNKTEQSVATYHLAIEAARQTEDYAGMISSQINVASLYMNLENYVRAVEILLNAEEESLLIPKDSTSMIEEVSEMLPGIHINLGLCYEVDGQIEKAFASYDKALESTKTVKDEYFATYMDSYTYNSLAILHESQSDWPEVIKNYDLALIGFESINNPQGVVHALTGKGGALVEMGQHEEAQAVLLEALKKATDDQVYENMRDIYADLAENAKALSDYENAVKYFEEHNQLKDSLWKAESQKVTLDLQEKYDTERLRSEATESELLREKEEDKAQKQRLYFIISLIALLGMGYVFYSRYKLRKERQAAELERSMNTAMARFVPTQFIESIGRSKITEVELGDQIEKELTVIFTDIRNFTSRSEKMTPTETFQFVKQYAEHMGPIINQYGGFINQYLGDGVMAIFDDPESALESCIDMHSAIEKYNINLVANGVQPIAVGMGVHTGPAVMGIIGDEVRRDAAMISDTINTAARMESKTKQFGVKILLSEESRKRLVNTDKYQLRHIGEISVKGKEHAIDLFECMNADEQETLDLKLSCIDHFDNAVESYLDEDYTIALDKFRSIQETIPDDLVIKSFIGECHTKLNEIQKATQIADKNSVPVQV